MLSIRIIILKMFEIVKVVWFYYHTVPLIFAAIAIRLLIFVKTEGLVNRSVVRFSIMVTATENSAALELNFIGVLRFSQVPILASL